MCAKCPQLSQLQQGENENAYGEESHKETG